MTRDELREKVAFFLCEIVYGEHATNEMVWNKERWLVKADAAIAIMSRDAGGGGTSN